MFSIYLAIGLAIFLLAFSLLYLILYIKDVKKGKYDISILKKKFKKLQLSRKKKRLLKSCNIILNTLAIVLIIFLGSMILISNNILPSKYQLLVVTSDSMAYKNEDNTYLDENNLNNQFKTNDLILIEKVSSYDEINLYDIICYQDSNQLVIHRVIDNSSNSYFITKGDANLNSDPIRVSFNQVIGKYTNFKIENIGEFIFFTKSIDGICLFIDLLMILASYLICDEITKKENLKRLKYLEDLFKDKTNYYVNSYQGCIQINNNNIVKTDLTKKTNTTEIIEIKEENNE